MNAKDKLTTILPKAVCRVNEPLKYKTTFNIGGIAQLYCTPHTDKQTQQIIEYCAENRLPYHILGGGANILIGDGGIENIVIATQNMNGFRIENDTLICESGALISDIALRCAKQGLEGMHSFYGMPGTVGGAVWINARCYGCSIDQLLVSVDYIDADGQIRHYTKRDADFSYKRSPFQHELSDVFILKATFKMSKAPPTRLLAQSHSFFQNRVIKGHYYAPCAGSIFKNNRAYGKPSGTIIDSLSLKHSRIGGAKVSPLHGNIFVNIGSATAHDMRRLIDHVSTRVQRAYGYQLEPEIQYIGKHT